MKILTKKIMYAKGLLDDATEIGKTNSTYVQMRLYNDLIGELGSEVQGAKNPLYRFYLGVVRTVADANVRKAGVDLSKVINPQLNVSAAGN